MGASTGADESSVAWFKHSVRLCAAVLNYAVHLSKASQAVGERFRHRKRCCCQLR